MKKEENMEKVYLMAGKRFKVDNRETRAVNDALLTYNLVMNVHPKDLWDFTVRRTSDPIGTSRYLMEHSFGEMMPILE